ANLNNWEPYATVVGTSTFIIEANTFADDAQFANQRYVVAFQPAAGGNSGLGEGFFADNGTPYKGQINLSRQNGNPGRVAGDKRPGAVHFITGGEASPHGFQEFLSDNRWTVNGIYTDVNRYTVVQTFALNPSTLAQMSTGKAFDPVNGKNTAAFSGNVPEVARFGGDLAGLDNGNFVVVIDDRSNMIEPTRAATAAIITPTGEVVKGGFSIGPGEIWSNVAAYRGGFCVRLGGVLYFYDNEGNLRGQVPQNASEVAFDGGRGDGTRLASHINSHYVYLAGAVTEPDPNDPTGPTIKVVRVAAFDARDFTFVAQAQVNEASFTPAIDRSNLAVDALNRVAVAYEARPTDFDAAQTVVRVLAFDGTTKSFTALTPSFFCFNNNGQTGFRTIRPSVAMTTRQICVAAKGEINSQDKPELGPDTLSQTTFYTVFSHPAPADDPTQSAVADLEFTAIANVGNAVRLTWEGGAGPFLLQRKASLSDAQWENLLTTPSRTAVVLRETSTAFYRLVDGAQNTVIPLSVSLSGDAEKPNAVTTAGTGMGTLILEGNTLRYRIPYSNLSSAASAAHIHGPATSTEATGVMKGLTGASGTSGVLSGSIDLTDEQKGHLLAGRTYVNVHTANHGGGEIRGQIVQSKLRATLSGAAERPNPVDTPGTGSGVIWVTGNQITFNISYSGLKAAATAGHIHGPATPEQATGVLFGFTGVSGTEGTIAGFGTVAPNVLGAIADGLTYVNIHTSAHTGGEIRGQIVP
ncbi:MAG: CHRD domain-containing protein, partial [Verrucomicrobiota bacterium]